MDLDAILSIGRVEDSNIESTIEAINRVESELAQENILSPPTCHSYDMLEEKEGLGSPPEKITVPIDTIR